MIRRSFALVVCATLLLVAACAPKSSADPLVGRWTGREGAVSVDVRFAADHTFRLSETDASGTTLLSDKPGTWSRDKKTDVYAITRVGSGMAFAYRVVGDELRPVEGRGVIYHRTR